MSNLRDDISTINNNEITNSENELYFCSFPNCLKKFKLKGNLKTHERIHVKSFLIFRLGKNLLSAII